MLSPGAQVGESGSIEARLLFRPGYRDNHFIGRSSKVRIARLRGQKGASRSDIKFRTPCWHLSCKSGYDSSAYKESSLPDLRQTNGLDSTPMLETNICSSTGWMIVAHYQLLKNTSVDIISLAEQVVRALELDRKPSNIDPTKTPLSSVRCESSNRIFLGTMIKRIAGPARNSQDP